MFMHIIYIYVYIFIYKRRILALPEEEMSLLWSLSPTDLIMFIPLRIHIGCSFISDSCACSEVVSYSHAERPPGALQPGMLTHHIASLRPPQPQSLVVLRTQ